jgi:hypothetical protein
MSNPALTAFVLSLGLLITACSGGGSSTPTPSAPAPTTFTLTIAKTGTGTGTVTSSTGGIRCGATCTGSYAGNTSVTLTATTLSGNTFSGWSGACSGTAACVLSMTANHSVTARFTAVATTGNATLSWIAPTARENGALLALSELAGYRIYYGTSADNTNLMIEVPGGSVTGHTITGLASGTYYFRASAYDTTGVESPQSGVVSKVVP